jgi:Protein of unknown function (DUF1634)
MTAKRNAKTDRLLSIVLNTGGLLAFLLTALGVVFYMFHASYADPVLRAGVIALMSTPVLRVALAIVAFWLERDYKYTLIATAVLLIVLTGAILRVAL